MFFRKTPVADVPGGISLTFKSEDYSIESRDITGRAIAKVRKLWFPTQIPMGDVFHSTYFTRCPHKDVPEVVTVHDMVPEVMPYCFEADINQEVGRKRDSILAAEKIISISQSTASDLVAIYPEVADRIEIIHSGAEHFSCVCEDDILSRSYSDAPYVIFLGDRRGYKNFGTLLDALTTIDWPKNLRLVVIGSRFSEGELLAIRYRGVEHLIHLVVHPTDSEMRELLIKANAFVFPSLIEGFGFPMVEAQALGVPVVASDTKVFREVGGNAFHPVDPMDPSSIATGVSKVLDCEVRLRLSLLGLQNVKRFSWDTCAARTLDVWRDVSTRRSS